MNCYDLKVIKETESGDGVFVSPKSIYVVGHPTVIADAISNCGWELISMTALGEGAVANESWSETISKTLGKPQTKPETEPTF